MTNLNKKRYPRVIYLFKFKQKLPEKRAGLFNLSLKRLKHPLKGNIRDPNISPNHPSDTKNKKRRTRELEVSVFL